MWIDHFASLELNDEIRNILQYPKLRDFMAFNGVFYTYQIFESLKTSFIQRGLEMVQSYEEFLNEMGALIYESGPIYQNNYVRFIKNAYKHL